MHRCTQLGLGKIVPLSAMWVLKLTVESIVCTPQQQRWSSIKLFTSVPHGILWPVGLPVVITQLYGDYTLLGLDAYLAHQPSRTDMTVHWYYGTPCMLHVDSVVSCKLLDITCGAGWLAAVVT